MSNKESIIAFHNAFINSINAQKTLESNNRITLAGLAVDLWKSANYKGEVHVYEGIKKIALQMDKELVVKKTDNEEYPFEASFVCDGIKYFQMKKKNIWKEGNVNNHE